jgi:hypothetical protein
MPIVVAMPTFFNNGIRVKHSSSDGMMPAVEPLQLSSNRRTTALGCRNSWCPWLPLIGSSPRAKPTRYAERAPRCSAWWRRHSAVLSAVVTIAMSFTVAACQPTIASEKAAITNASHTNPDHVRH